MMDSNEKAHEIVNKDVPIVAKFLTKQEREKLALEKLEQQRKTQLSRVAEAEEAHGRFVTGRVLEEKKREESLKRERELEEKLRRQKEENKESKEIDYELKSIREHYLGQAEKKRKILKPSEKFARIFQFDWEAEDDTARNDVNPLYSNRVQVNTLFGRGYMAGTDQREQRKHSNFLLALSEKRMNEMKQLEESDSRISEAERRERELARALANESLRQSLLNAAGDKDAKVERSQGHWSEKALSEMTERDWRIFREDFDIRVQGIII